MAEGKLPVVLLKWYDYTNWLLDRIDAFPKNQRFIFGQRMADLALGILEKLIEFLRAGGSGAVSQRMADLALGILEKLIEFLRAGGSGAVSRW